MLLLKTDAACSRCPLNLLCVTLRPLPDVTYCRRCCAVTFDRDGERYLCLRLREGVYSRYVDDAWQQLDQMSEMDRMVSHVVAALGAKHGTYLGCARRRKRYTYKHTLSYRWKDCVEYFTTIGNGFDRVF